ncbi:hypothetical protein CHISP_3014 [Chitinispirillum alkaliphilum]|nr:hypothetical protein CHISP_3014 [Chitinispirillum alkaliphilum]
MTLAFIYFLFNTLLIVGCFAVTSEIYLKRLALDVFQV